VEILELRIVEEGPESLLGGPLDQDHHLARLHALLTFQRLPQPAQGNDPATVFGDGFGRAARVAQVEVVLFQVEQV
jgi:hypothetical protein